MKTAYVTVFTLALFVFELTTALNHPAYADSESSWQTLPAPTSKISRIESTRFGLLAGENDGRLWINPYNGIYLSKDFGATWQKFGLEQRGIMDITYSSGKVYAATYYHYQNTNGLFIYQPENNQWIQRGPKISLNAVAADRNTILVGSLSHGLWLSSDGGETWIQKIGDGYSGPKIDDTSVKANFAIAVATNKVYLSQDAGLTWNEITILRDKGITQTTIIEDVIFAGGTSGMYTSKDGGSTWNKISELGATSIADLSSYGYKLFTVTKGASSELKMFNLLSNSWTSYAIESSLLQNQAVDITWAQLEKTFIYLNIPSHGILRSEHDLAKYLPIPLLEIPWEYTSVSELIDKIYSYFDHEYPLLGYPYLREDTAEKDTTLNFSGIRAPMPRMYYSGHDGYDFSLPYGKPILAAKEGTASYNYDKNGLGNFITIKHEGGFQTVYAHLQKEGLITNKLNTPIQVTTGQQIGLVGLTGNTTGPHLHFSVEYDTNGDGLINYLDVGGRTDPFGWQNMFIVDPWARKYWTDTISTHNGTLSNYMWKYFEHEEVKQFVTKDGNTMQNSIWKIDFPGLSQAYDFLAKLAPSSSNDLNNMDKALALLPGTAMVLNAYNLTAENVETFEKPITLTAKLSLDMIANFIITSLKINFYDTQQQKWIPLESTINIEENVITAQSNHLTKFAVIGEKINKSNPNTLIQVIGEKNEDWYIDKPKVILTGTDPDQDDIAKTYYSTDEGINWELYTQPFYIDRDGVNILLYRSVDKNENWEDIRETTIKIDLNGNRTHNTPVVKNLRFLNKIE